MHRRACYHRDALGAGSVNILSSFKFVHAADLHLDSPLLGLASKSAHYAARIEAASREAFDNLIELTISEQCRFLLLSGDIFDGDLRNFQTGLYFMDGMRRLGEAGVQVYMLLGNHDAENRFAPKLKLSDNVYIFPNDNAATFYIEDLGVALHGRSFARHDITENLAASYPAPNLAQFNIGLLHTACEGSEGHHARYAPCTPEQLRNHGYDYWALGHVHAHSILGTHPHIIYSGNLQGRHPRETGPKGAVLVAVEDGRVTACEHRALDVVRWAVAQVDISAAEDRAEMLDALRLAVLAEAEGAQGRPLALRLTLTGETALHGALMLDSGQLRQDVELLLTTLPQDIWLEKLRLATNPPAKSSALDPTVAGQMEAALTALADDEEMQDILEKKLGEIRAKLPAHAHADDFTQQMRADILARAADVARSLMSEAGHENH